MNADHERAPYSCSGNPRARTVGVRRREKAVKNLIVVAGALALAGVASVLVGMTQPHAAESGQDDMDPSAAEMPAPEHGKLVQIPVPAREDAAVPARRPMDSEAPRQGAGSDRE
jgi:hypothetical protein